jgi:hypothetical protein
MDALRRFGALQVLATQERSDWAEWFDPAGDDE